jgi:hypothetical protein
LESLMTVAQSVSGDNQAYIDELRMEFDIWARYHLKNNDYDTSKVIEKLYAIITEKNKGDWFTEQEWRVWWASRFGFDSTLDMEQRVARLASLDKAVPA